MEPVRSRQNRKVVEAARLLRARDGRRTLLQGAKLLDEATSASVVIHRLFVLDADDAAGGPPNVDVVLVTESVMQRLTPTGDTWGPVAVIDVPDRGPRSGRPVLVAHRISDPGNLGTMIRSAAAFGYDVVCVDGTDPWSPKTLRAGAGGHFRTHVTATADLPDRQVIAAVALGGRPPDQVDAGPDHALVIGSEAHGLPDDLVADAQLSVTIPMEAAESLNAGVAAAVLMYEMRKHSKPQSGRD